MSIETPPPPKGSFIDRIFSQERRDQIFQKRIEIASTTLLALATILTAWSGYQSARWGGEQMSHSTNALRALVKVGQYENLAEQRQNLHVTLFGQYIEALSVDNVTFAEQLFTHFPEPLKTATIAWRATKPETNPAAFATPFQLPEYALAESAEAERWDAISLTELEAEQVASEISDRYLLFTIIFASVLFFGGVSGKFGWQPIDLAVLLMGTLVLVAASIILFNQPII